jgi:NAD(P)-dependent dehydrogenase (short-subunit alcohol dehydrogenase family)
VTVDSPDFGLSGSRALVTGAGRGIGAGCVLALAGAGADVVLLSRTAGEIEGVAAEARALGVEASALTGDVTDAAAVRDRVAAAGPVDILVNAAGTNVPAAFLELGEDDYDKVMDANVKGTFLVTQAFVAGLRERGARGSVINISSQMGRVGDANRTVYCASKHAVEGFTKALAVELAPERIRVNAVAPTYIDTPMTRPFFESEEFRERTLDRIPLGRIGEVADVVGAVVYLASPAAALVTGVSLLVDGGYTAR